MQSDKNGKEHSRLFLEKFAVEVLTKLPSCWPIEQ
jgi:hypothetical protein